MSSRFPPNSSDSRYQPRGHTPPGFDDRRSSALHNGPLSSRGPEASYRENTTHSLSRDIPREAPRGPKATLDSGRGGGFGPRGRGFGGRIDTRDARDSSFQRRDENREWPRRNSFENRDRRPSPGGRNRSRTPPARDYRESRDVPPGHLDLSRVRRGSRDGPLSATSSVSEAPASAGFYGRGSHRGRGRGDWDFRGRGRGNFSDERVSVPTRSRSRDRMRDRDTRDDRSREHDRETCRREEEKRYPKEDWDRDPDRYRRDTTLQRPDSRNSSGTQTRPSTPHSTSIPPSNLNNMERSTVKTSAVKLETERRSSATAVAVDVRDESRSYQSSYRPESSRVSTAAESPSSPPQPTQVPAFGSSFAHRGPPGGHNSSNSQQQTRDEPPSSAPARFELIDPIRVAPKAPKAELVQTQPPTGPKAGPPFARRQPVVSTASPARSYDIHHDVRPLILSGATTTSSPAIIRFGAPQRAAASQFFSQPPTTPTVQLNRPTNPRSMMQTGQRPGHLEVSTPSGPANSEQSTRYIHAERQARGLQGAAALTGSPVKIPRGPKVNTQPSIRAPMAPRVGHNTWINPILRPSIMNTVPATISARVPAKRDHTGEERTGKPTENESQREISQESSKALVELQPPRLSGQETVESMVRDYEKPLQDDFNFPPEPVSALDTASDGEKVLGSQQNSASDDDDGMDLDEDDFEEAEKQFTRDVQRLDARRPPTPRHHAELLPLLEEVDALASAAEDLANGVLPDFNLSQEKREMSIPLGLPSPRSEGITTEQSEVIKAGIAQDYEYTESPPLSEFNLPFLPTGPPTPLSEVLDVRDNNISHDLIKDRILAYLSEDKARLNEEYEALRAEYAHLYKDWKLGVIAIEEEKALLEEANCATPSPVPPEAPAVVTVPVIEVRRAGRSSHNVSEYDLQRVIELSIKETAEAEEIREKKAQENQALADLQKEAAIPDMLSLQESKSTRFEDRNNLVATRMALEVFGFNAPTDPFDPETHKLFAKLYMLNPKRWSLIAKAIPGYDYQDCIHHYYVTKKQSKYKEEINRVSTKKTYRKTGQKRGKPGALIGGRVAMYDGNDEDIPPPALTEAGRPRRAVAPVFGGKEVSTENDPVTPVPTPGRRVAGQSRLEVSGDSTSERPSVKRTRTAQKEKGAKRGKAPLLAAAPGPPASKNEAEIVRARSREPKLEDHPRSVELEDLKAPLGPELAPQLNMGPWTGGSRGPDNPIVLDVPFASLHPPPTQQQQQQQQHQTPQLSQEQHPRPPSSYWSVPETQDFLKLVAHYGTDWVQISRTLTNKTHIMVKNQFFREVEKGKKDLEILAEQADQRIKRGEQSGNPPQHSLIPRRRPDPVPHVAAHRPLAPNTEPSETGIGSPNIPSIGSTQVSPPHHQQTVPRLAPLLQAGTAPVTSSAHSPLQNNGPSNTATAQPPRSLQSLQGPRAGYFPTERLSQSTTQPGSSNNRFQSTHEQQPTHHHLQQQHQQRRPYQRQLESHEFEELLTRQHEAKQPEPEPQRAVPVYAQQTKLVHAVTPSQPGHAQHPNHLLQSRTLSNPLIDTERKVRPPAQPPQPPRDPSPPPLRRLDSIGQPSYLPPHNHSPTNARPLAISPSQELARPSSVPTSGLTANIQPPQRPPPVPAKISNIKSILNDEPTDPHPRKSVVDHRVAAPTPPPHSPAISSRMYNQSGQPLPQIPRREAIVDTVLQQQPVQQQQNARLPYAQHNPHMQQQMHQQMQVQQHQAQHLQLQLQFQQQQMAQHRAPPHAERGVNWPAAVNRTFSEQRPPYQSHPHTTSSPQVQTGFPQTSSRAVFPPLQATRAPSPPLTATHSRTSSYSGLHLHQNSQQGIPVQSSQPLQPSPYAKMQPQQYPQQLQPHPQQPRTQSSFAMPNLQHEQMLRQQQEAQRQQESRRLNEQSRRENITRTYTPPPFAGHPAYGNGPPLPPQQQQDQVGKRRGYEDMR